MNPTDAEVSVSTRLRALLERVAELEKDAEGSRRQISALERKLAWTNAKMRDIDAALFPMTFGELPPEWDRAVRRAWAIARENS